MSVRRLFFALLPATLLFRLWLAWAMPITGDEAYFVDWGRHPDWGFYDHPPMVGWWLAAQLLVGDAQVWLRLSAILQPALLAFAVAAMASRLTSEPRPPPPGPRPGGEGDGCSQAAPAPGQRGVSLGRPGGDAAERAWWAALLLLLAPVNVWNVFITTDTPLIYFSVLAALAWLRATQDDHRGWYAAAGIMLAGAVLSKYFAALLGFALLVHALSLRRRGALGGLVIAYACTLPALALMAWWNAGHCWANVMFNFVNRNEGAGLNAMTPLLYAVTLLYVVSPPALWLWWRSRGRDGLWLLAAVPFALFALLSLAKTVGLHWLLGFVPLVLLWLALRLPEATLKRLGNFFIGFAALHVIIIAAVALVPMESWKRTQLYDGIVLTFEAERLIERLQPFAADYAFASDGYSNAATLSYHLAAGLSQGEVRSPVEGSERSERGGPSVSPQRFMVFGEGGYHARQDDFLTDWRSHDGRNILILTKRRPASADFFAYFHEVEFKEIELRGVTFTAVLGRGFNYAAYRDDVLARIKSRYYALPAWLPQSGCVVCDRYFPDKPCTP